jgi:hypothetical protein
MIAKKNIRNNDIFCEPMLHNTPKALKNKAQGSLSFDEPWGRESEIQSLKPCKGFRHKR